ncbi:MAG: alpha/beta fold hydrolase [Caldilinea sp. CFX5]|nr:alpha/beta fold hydrolase [Caldilinea sp. CFX5]
MQIFSRKRRSVPWLLALSVLLLALTACQPIVDDRSPVEKAFDAGELMAINGTELFVKVVGEGEPIIMLHGGPGAEHIFFSKYTEVLADDYQLIYYDQRSTGFSIPDTEPANLTIDTFVEDLEGIRQALKLEQVTLLGWSWGGNLAMYYAAKYPQYLNGIILVDPGNIDPAFDEAFNAKFEERTTPEELDALDAAYQKLTTEKSGEAYNEFARLLLPIYMADKSLIHGLEIVIPDNSAIYGDAVAAGLFTDLETYDELAAIARITSPTLIIHGDEDLIPLESSQQIHEAIAGSQLVVLEGIGHIPFVEAPVAFFATVRDFMQQITE